MKKILQTLAAAVVTVTFLSCGTMNGLKRNIAIIDAPNDLVVVNTQTGEKLEIKQRKVGSKVTTVNSTTNKQTNYYAPAVRVKPKKHLLLELQSGGITKTVDFGIKRNYGFIVVESVFSIGLFGIVDLITGGMNDHKKPYIDVPAVLQGKPQRTNRQLFKDTYN